MTSNYAEDAVDRIEIMTALLQRISEHDSPEIIEDDGDQYVPLEQYRSLERSLNLILFQAEMMVENLEFNRGMIYAMVNEFKRRGINPFENGDEN